MKSWIIDFKLPQLSAAKYWHSVSVQAPDLGLAVKRGWAEIKKRPGVKGKRLKEATISISIIEGTE